MPARGRALIDVLCRRGALAVAVAAMSALGVVGCARGPAGGGPGQSGSGTQASPVATAPSGAVTDSPAAARPAVVAGFVVIGDFGGGSAQQSVADAMVRWKRSGHRVDVLVTVGDNVYDRGEPSKFAAQLDVPYEALGVPKWIALGNHDAKTSGGRQQLEHVGMPAPPSEKRLEGVTLLFLDSNHVDSAQAGWMGERLEASAREGRRLEVVVYHHPAYSCGTHGSTRSVIDKWVPVIREHAPELVLNGHDHNYQRFTDGPTTHVVTGGGGKELAPPITGCPTEAALETAEILHEFLAVEVYSDGSWSMQAVGTDGEVFDRAGGRVT